MTTWIIKGTTEDTQSSTFMPLICSVIDGFHVTFPDGYKAIFNSLCGPRLPFSNFKGFQSFLRRSVQEQIGGTSVTDFNNAKDHHPYHFPADLQERILGGGTPHALDYFYGMFIIQLKRQLPGQQCVLVETHRGHHTGKAPRGHHTGEAHRGAEKKWYFINDRGEDQPYSDDDNRKIMIGESIEERYRYNPVISTGHIIDLTRKVQINKHSKTERPIVFKGGKTKKRRKTRYAIRNRH